MTINMMKLLELVGVLKNVVLLFLFLFSFRFQLSVNFTVFI